MNVMAPRQNFFKTELVRTLDMSYEIVGLAGAIGW